MDIKIRFAKKDDAQGLAELDRIAHKELENWVPNNKADFMKIIRKFKDSLVVAKKDNNIIGYLSLRLDKDSGWIWIENIYIINSLRKKGIAKDMIKKATHYLRRKHSRRIVLLTPDRNLAIFSKLGFKKTMNFMEFIGERK
ncbi:MAG: GNAT family N-acetyltransferase [Nanoarchaeota archaeon]|nr:GNAT family N-acetyltransferase [Nanoarchaeota archaeon]